VNHRFCSRPHRQEEERVKAERRGDTNLRVQEWADGQGKEQVSPILLIRKNLGVFFYPPCPSVCPIRIIPTFTGLGTLVSCTPFAPSSLHETEPS
jgi:hypothetical protein